MCAQPLTVGIFNGRIDVQDDGFQPTIDLFPRRITDGSLVGLRDLVTANMEQSTARILGGYADPERGF
jgi:hypothetical protein